MIRYFIDEDRVIIVLDTTVIRELCYGEPNWLSTFVEMSHNEYDFCLADHLVAELLNQLQRNSISSDEYQSALKKIDRFISQRLPILPGNRELFGMCNISKDEYKFDPDETLNFSIATYKILSSAKSFDEILNGIKISFGENIVEVFLKDRKQIQKAIDEERRRWIEEIKSHNEFTEKELDKNKNEILNSMAASIDEKIKCDPPLSIRLDIAIKHRFRQIKIANRLHTPYDPESKKKINDGIDYNMDFIFMLPAILCTSDRNYYKIIKELNSFQSKWIYLPDEISDKWRDKALLPPSWPKVGG